jgi:hypothetical protein
MKIFKQKIPILAACVGIASVLPIQNSQAGWTGYLLGSGSGWAYVSVSPYVNGAYLPAKQLKTPSTLSPGAWMAAITPAQDPLNTIKYTSDTLIPTGASANTISRAKGFPGVIWQAYTAGANGDKTDNFELQSRVKITPTTCPSLVMDSKLIGFDGTTGQINVNTLGTLGTALWVRGFEITADMDVPEDDITTPQNETTEYLKANADLRFENLMIGPFNYGYNNTCGLVIHFTLKGGSIDNLAFVTDGVALSEPIKITCPPRQFVECGTSGYIYPTAVATGGCGKFTYSFSPAVRDLVLGDNTVTMTATDEEGDSESCTFTVTVTDKTAPTPPPLVALPDVTSACGTPVTLPAPIAVDDCMGNIIGTTTTQFPITKVGTTDVVWTFNDGNGNSSKATQKVVISGMTLVGFYAPIGTIGGECSRTAKDIKLGSVIPIKFDVKCGATLVTTGTPPVVKIEKYSATCGLEGERKKVNAEYQNDWHANWDTTGWDKGIYKIIVVMPDLSEAFVFVNLK